ncbi:unnamed protein product [marine sediment metagenome]|uniref:Uncharacterized protein n=1 Tax=marine sediment metagenome TaxID=412755 RepID=X1N2E7_9ZZZZ
MNKYINLDKKGRGLIVNPDMDDNNSIVENIVALVKKLLIGFLRNSFSLFSS